MKPCPNGYDHRGQQCMCALPLVRNPAMIPPPDLLAAQLRTNVETLRGHQARLARSNIRLLTVDEAVQHDYPYFAVVHEFGIDAASMAYWRAQEGEAS